MDACRFLDKTGRDGNTSNFYFYRVVIITKISNSESMNYTITLLHYLDPVYELDCPSPWLGGCSLMRSERYLPWIPSVLTAKESPGS